MKTLTLKKTVLAGLFSALALISFVIESLFPPLFIPGARLGISNVFVLLSAVILGSPYAMFTLVIKTVLGSVFSGNVFSIIYSLPAGAVSLAIELLLLKKIKRFSMPAISLVGAVVNNVLQNVTYCFVSGFWGFMVYSPYLIAIGSLAGLFIGFTVHLTIKLIPESVYDKINQ